MAHYSKQNKLVRRLYSVTASANFDSMYGPANSAGQGPRTTGGPQRANWQPTSGSYIYNYPFEPKEITFDVPVRGKIRDIKIWIEFIHDYRSLSSIAGRGLGAVTIALRSPNTDFFSGHPLFNDPSLAGRDLFRNNSVANFNKTEQLHDIYKNSYILWDGLHVSKTWALTNLFTNVAENFDSYVEDIDMRTVFTDSSKNPNPRHREMLYSSPEDYDSGPTIGKVREFISASSPNHLLWELEGYPCTYDSNGIPFAYKGYSVPWFLDENISTNPATSRVGITGTIAFFTASSSPPPGWLTGNGGQPATSGEFNTSGSNIGVTDIKPMYPLLDDIVVERIYDEPSAYGQRYQHFGEVPAFVPVQTDVSSSVTFGAPNIYGQQQITGISGFTASSTGSYLIMTGANSGNNGTFLIVSYTSPTDITVLNENGVSDGPQSTLWSESYVPTFPLETGGFVGIPGDIETNPVYISSFEQTLNQMPLPGQFYVDYSAGTLQFAAANISVLFNAYYYVDNELQTFPQGIRYSGFRPGLRGTQVQGKWKLLIANQFEYDSFGNPDPKAKSGIFFRQARLEFLLDENEEPDLGTPQSRQRYRVTGQASTGKKRRHIMSGTAYWDGGVNYVYEVSQEQYGRSVGIIDDESSANWRSFSVFTQVTGNLVDDLSASNLANLQRHYLQNEFGTPYIPLSSGSGVSPTFDPFTTEEIIRSREIITDVINPTTLVDQSPTLSSVLNRSDFFETTSDQAEAIVEEIYSEDTEE